jgi:hypothetical protein
MVDAADAVRRWQEVYDARTALYERHFGPMPEDVTGLHNLAEAWPGGCLVQIGGSKGYVTASFGLTNADMPADRASVVAARAADAQGEIPEAQLAVLAALPEREPPEGLAGYGYELVVRTYTAEFWPLMFLNWAVQAEILYDGDLLARVREFGGVTVEGVGLAEEGGSDFLIAPAHAPVPSLLELPNGGMHLLVATTITRPELELSLTEGIPALQRLLNAEGIGQFSQLGRPSTVAEG